MKLTRRQQEFVEKLIDLSVEFDGPIHYSTLAERLGVSPFTAYDMLRLLEEKGMVTSEYHVAEGKTGPGRAERLFFPVNHRGANKYPLEEKFGDMSPTKDELRRFMLDKVRQGQFPDQEMVEELLARIPPDGPDHIRYCLEVLTVMALRLRRLAGRQKFLAHLSAILPGDTPVTAANLCLLGGFAYGVLAQEESKDHEWSQILLEHVLRYQKIVCTLDQQECRFMSGSLNKVLSPLTTIQN